MQSLLMTSGCWQSFRTRPFGRIADPAKIPDAIFLTAMDTAPLAGDPAPVIKRFETWFRLGAAALCHLTDGPVYICHGNDASLPVVDGTKSVAFSAGIRQDLQERISITFTLSMPPGWSGISAIRM